jgi:hypothetical protein
MEPKSPRMLTYVPDVIFDVCKQSDALEYLLHSSEKGKDCCPHADIFRPVLGMDRMPENDCDDFDKKDDVFRPVQDRIPENLVFDEHAFMQNVDTLSFVKALSSHTERLTTFHRSVQSFCMAFHEPVGDPVQSPEMQYEDSNSQTYFLGTPRRVLSDVALSCVVLCSCLGLPCLVLCCLVLSCPVLSSPVLCYLVLSYLVLSCLGLSYFVF